MAGLPKRSGLADALGVSHLIGSKPANPLA